MAEFQEVMKQWRRMCNKHLCADKQCGAITYDLICPITISHDGYPCDSGFVDCSPESMAQVEQIVMEWAAEHPEPEALVTGFGEWISVKDRLPDAAGVYLVCGMRISRTPYIYTAHFATDLCQNPLLEWEGVEHEPGFWNGDGDEDWIEPGVTHWMPLPELPEVTKNG